MYDGNKEKFLQWWRTLRSDKAAGRFADLYAQEVDFDMDTQTFKEFAKKVGETFLPKRSGKKQKENTWPLNKAQRTQSVTSLLG